MIGRTLAVQRAPEDSMAPRKSARPTRQETTKAGTRRRCERLEVRTTTEERQLIDRAVAATGTDLTEFVVTNLTVAAQRVLADRTRFELDDEALQAWESMNRRGARDLPGLRALMQRPSPFTER
jgi:uncharacterized protein (DUF1778 family)